ncbi:hypothetical protein LEMLEM_LOCUS13744 [Lemmus lemmus]
MRASSISVIISTYLWRSCLPPCAVAVPKLAGFGPKGQRMNAQPSFTRGEAVRDTYRRSAVFPGAEKKAEFQFRGGFGGQPPQ